MKPLHKASAFLILLVTPLLLSGIIAPIINDEGKTAIAPDLTKVSVPSYETHAPIEILNDTAFDEMAADELWYGDGSPGAPYLIEGYNITSDSHCIDIFDVSVCFEIRDCFLSSFTDGSGMGIGIINATQVSIINTVIEKKAFGMDLELIDSLTITTCTVTDIGNDGLFFDSCEGLIVDGCNIYDIIGDGISLHNSNESLVANCNITNVFLDTGIYVASSHFVTIFHNEISECSTSGIWAINSLNITIENNTIHDNWFFAGPMCGIHLLNSDYATVVGNEIYNNARNGIYVNDSDWVYIFDNEIYGNSDHGIDAQWSSNGTILQNNIHGNGWWPVILNAMCGIHLGPYADWIISDNSIWNNTPSGITVDNAERVEISNNHIFNNTAVGIYGIAGEGHLEINISENLIHDNGFYETTPDGVAGILLSDYDYCNIENNQVYNNSDHGIYFYGDYNRIIGNEVYGSETGVGSYECYNNTISNNIVYDCLGGIFVINIGTNVTDNIIYDNDYGIYMENSGNCLIYGNDIGWNEVNAFESDTFAGMPLLWYDNVSVGNWWHNYNYNGFYNISSDTGDDNVDIFPSKSLELVPPDAIDYEILETGNTLVWEAYALHPSHYELFIDGESVMVESWDGGDIEINVDGLADGSHSIELEVYHISGHSMGNASAANVEDLTPPSLEGLSHIEITMGENISTQYTAEDPSGIGNWAVNDTVNFAIDSTGLLTSITNLPVGEYTIRIEVSDVFGHTTYHDVTITVTAQPDGGFPTLMALAIGAGGVIIILVVVAIGYKRRGT